MNKPIKFECAKMHYLILQINVNNACSTFVVQLYPYSKHNYVSIYSNNF